jgi:hypothetical protein
MPCNIDISHYNVMGAYNYFSKIGKQSTLGCYFLQVEEQVGLDDVKWNIVWDLP